MYHAPSRGATRPSLWAVAFTLSHPPKIAVIRDKHKTLTNDKSYHELRVNSRSGVVPSTLGLSG